MIDPEPIRCDDSFANHPPISTVCSHHFDCRPVAVEVVAAGIIGIAAEQTLWTIDVRAGRYWQSDSRLKVRFLPPDAWTAVIAICVTPTQIRALTLDGPVITSTRAHHGRAVA